MKRLASLPEQCSRGRKRENPSTAIKSTRPRATLPSTSAQAPAPPNAKAILVTPSPKEESVWTVPISRNWSALLSSWSGTTLRPTSTSLSAETASNGPSRGSL
jgi:hypothetical protein